MNEQFEKAFKMVPQLGKFLGRGVERFCYENLNNPNTCLKVSNKKLSKQTLREVAYFRFLQKKGIQPSFMPKFIQLHETNDSYILEQQYFKSNQEITVIGLREYIATASDSELEQLEQFLPKVKQEMLYLNVIVSDMRTTNFLVISKDSTISRVIIFDGYGAPEFLHLPNICPFLGKLKIERQWKKFLRYYTVEKDKRGSR